MTIEITLGTVSTALGIIGTAGKIVHSLVKIALEERDAKIAEMGSSLKAARETDAATRRILFDKLDAHHKEFTDYKLHVAETYIVETKMEKLLAPVLSRLENIERDIRGERRDRSDRERT